jgi:hypothetical protein
LSAFWQDHLQRSTGKNRRGGIFIPQGEFLWREFFLSTQGALSLTAQGHSHFFREGLRREGFLQKRNVRLQDAVVHNHIVCVPGHVQHFQIRSPRRQLLGQFAPVHFRHHHVGQQKVNLAFILLADGY